LHWQRDGMALVRESWNEGTKRSQEEVEKGRLYDMLLPLVTALLPRKKP
jgi:hypothetical protein